MIKMRKKENIMKMTHEAIRVQAFGREENAPRRVAAYCRVSTLLEEQELSYESQCAYYESLIENSPDMELVGVYGDQGFSGLHAKNRPEFMRMIRDCLDGRIDLIMVKSISRFSRNTLECQYYVNLLKEHGVTVQFEREGINSGDPQCEFILKLLSAAAQEESNSISQTIQWAQLKNNESGYPTRICPGEGEAVNWVDRNPCHNHIVRAFYIDQAVLEGIRSLKPKGHAKEINTAIARVQKVTAQRGKVELYHLKLLVKSIEFPDWESIRINWKGMEPMVVPMRCTRAVDHPDPVITDNKDGSFQVGSVDRKIYDLQKLQESLRNNQKILQTTTVEYPDPNDPFQIPIVRMKKEIQ